MDLERINEASSRRVTLQVFLAETSDGGEKIRVLAEDEREAWMGMYDYGWGKGVASLFEESPEDKDEPTSKILLVTRVKTRWDGDEVCGILFDQALSSEELKASVSTRLASIAKDAGEGTGYEAFPREFIDSCSDDPKVAASALRAYLKLIHEAEKEGKLPGLPGTPMKERLGAYLAEQFGEDKVFPGMDSHFLEQDTPWYEGGYSGSFENAVMDIVAVAKYGLDAPLDLGDQALIDAALEGFDEGTRAKDHSKITDLINGEHLMTWIPGWGARLALEDLNVTCDAITGSYMDVVPDEIFANWLRLMNISSDEWKEVVENNGGSLAGVEKGGYQWDAFHVEKVNPDKPPLVNPANVALIIENTNGYGVPTLAVNVRIEKLLSLRPGDQISIRGGQFGLHDYINGSGYVEDLLEEPIQITFSPGEWTVDKAPRYHGYGIDSVYGMTRAATDAHIEFPDRYTQHMALAKEWSDAVRAHLETVAPAEGGSQRVISSYCAYGVEPGMTLVEAIKAAQWEYRVPIEDLNDLLTDEEKAELSPKEKAVEATL